MTPLSTVLLYLYRHMWPFLIHPCIRVEVTSGRSQWNRPPQLALFELHVWMGLFLYNFHQPKAALPSYGLRCRKLDNAFFCNGFWLIGVGKFHFDETPVINDCEARGPRARGGITCTNKNAVSSPLF